MASKTTFAPPGKALKILDLGCGQCDSIDYLDQYVRNYEFHGVDHCQHSLKRAKSKAKNLQCSSLGDFESDHKFDLILAFESIYYLNFSDREKCVKKIQQAMHKDSMLVVSSCLSDSDKYFTEKKLQILFHKHGLEVVAQHFIHNRVYSYFELLILNWAQRPCFNIYRKNIFDVLYLIETFNIFFSFYILQSKLLYFFTTRLSRIVFSNQSKSHVVMMIQKESNH